MPSRKPLEKLKAERVEMWLNTLPGWSVDRELKALTFQVRFPSQAKSLAFVRRICQMASSRRHFPDVALEQSAVTVKLSTPQVGGLSDEDFRFARQISREA